MNLEEQKNTQEKIETPEEQREAPVVKPEELGEQMLEQSQKEIADFQAEGESEMGNIEKSAAGDGLIIDREDRAEFDSINRETKNAETDLMVAVNDKNQEWDPNGTEPPPIPKEEKWTPDSNFPPPLDDEEKLNPNMDESLLSPGEEELSDKEYFPIETPEFPKNEKTEKENGEQSEFEEIDSELLQMNMDQEKRKRYVEDQKNLPPNAIVYMYNGLNGGYEKALDVINSKVHGVEQRSGPCLSFIPVGQFWKPGGLGFRYALRRDQIAFPGENNPNAVVQIEGEIEDVGKIINESGGLSLAQFEAEVMSAKGTDKNAKLENEINEKLSKFAEVRIELSRINNETAVDQKNKIKELLTDYRTQFLDTGKTVFFSHPDFRHNAHSMGRYLHMKQIENFSPLQVSGEQLIGNEKFGDESENFFNVINKTLSQIESVILEYEEDEKKLQEGDKSERNLAELADVKSKLETINFEKEIISKLKDETKSGLAIIKSSVEDFAKKINSKE